MNKPSKILSVALCACMTLPLVACNGGGMREKYLNDSLMKLYDRFEGDLERGTEAKPITLHILENDTAKSSGYLKELLDGFNEKYRDHHIVAVDANQDQYSDLATDGPYGYGPDVLYQANDAIMKYCSGKHIIPLPVDKLDAYAELPPLAKQAYTYTLGGTEFFMGVGVNIQAPMLYYRKDLLPDDWEATWDDNKNGVPDMVEDMRAMYRFGVQRHGADDKKYGYMHSLNDPYFSCGYLFTYGAYVFGSNNTDINDIGFGASDSYKGAGVVMQLAESMNSGCIDDSITKARESEFAKGTYFAVNNTQDMFGTLQNELISEYRKQGMSAAEAKNAADANIGAAPLPALPESGDLGSTDSNEKLLPSIVMGGINGYAVSSYTKYPKASLAFVNYATSYEMILRRNALLGISPARSDCNRDCTYQADVAHDVLTLARENRISIMPSIPEVAQIWTPIGTALTELATDPYRERAQKKYVKSDGSINYAALQALLDEADTSIHEAIFTFA